MSGHCKRCMAVVWRDGHRVDCPEQNCGRVPPRSCVPGKRVPEAWVLPRNYTTALDKRSAA